MQLLDLFKPLESMTEDELREHLQNIRHNRNFIKPAAAGHVKRATKKTSRAKVTKTEDLIDKLDEAGTLALMKMLQEHGAG